nr:pilus assembly protein PilM [Patescibacteria group bacterium]
KNTIISIYSDFAIRFTRTLGTGFENFVKAVSQDLKLESLQAEEYIKTYGFINDKLNGKIKDALIPIYSLILEEIKRSISFFETRSFGKPVKRVVLTGGGSALPAIVVFTANYLGFEVQLGNSFSRFASLGKYKNRKTELEDISPIFATSVGLSLKPFK